uniref:Uncharacterized protein n=1 Tax=Chenopodium quinoa TaxID=63459 RepID=A0A803KMG1_CHEQI
MERVKEDEDDIVCLDESFFINDNYQLTTFTFGSQVLELFCLNSASTDFDLTGQLVWPGAVLLNEYLSKNAEMLQGLSVIELGSGVGVTGVLCSKFCKKVVMTDHNDEILKKNIDLHASSESYPCPDSGAEKLEWANSDQRNEIVQRYPEGFDLSRVFFKSEEKEDADSFWVMFLVPKCLPMEVHVSCELVILQSPFCSHLLPLPRMDQMVLDEARGHGLSTKEVAGTRSIVGNLEGVIYEITL